MNKVKIIKILSLIASAAGTLGMAWVTTKENDIMINKAVEKYLKTKGV